MAKKTEINTIKTEVKIDPMPVKDVIDKPRRQKARRRKHPRKPMPVFLRVGLSMVFLLIITFIFTWYMINEQFARDTQDTGAFLQEHAVVFLYNYVLVFLLTATLAAILWRPFLAAGIMFSIISVFMYINTQKYHYRAMPLLPEDFQMVEQAGELAEFVDPWGIVRLVCGVIFVIIGTGLMEFFAKRLFGKDYSEVRWWERFAIVPRCSFAAMAFVSFALLAEPLLHPGAKSIEKIDGLGVDFQAWLVNENYKNNGFLVAFLYNMGNIDLPEPENYNQATVNEIAEKYEDIKNTTEPEADLPALSEVVDNVIFVMDESFYDPAVLGELYAYAGGDVTPNLHKIFQKYPSGYMYSPEYGGNTANVEFAAFTGLSNYWLNGVPYANFAAKLPALPGMVSLAKDNGFATAAVHAYSGRMYKRNLVYARMGFDEFRDYDAMTHKERENGSGYVNDKSIYQEVLDILGDNNSEKHLVGAITMQNHTPYDAALYDGRHFELKNYVENAYDVTSSYESLYHADQYLGDFIAELNKLEEKTVMIWFGDHAAGVLGDYVDSDDQDLINLAHLTPYFIYANFELDNDYTAKEVTEINAESGFKFATLGVDLPTVTPNCLPNILYNLLDIKKPALMYLLDTVCEETPILAPIYYNEELPDESKALKEYEIINYDFSNGNNYWLKR